MLLLLRELWATVDPSPQKKNSGEGWLNLCYGQQSRDSCDLQSKKVMVVSQDSEQRDGDLSTVFRQQGLTNL